MPHGDILVIGRNKEEHDERLVKVLQRLKDSGITLNPDKCLFSTSRLQYLGQVIDSDGIRKDPAKIKAITELPEPKDVPNVRQFLGMVNELTVHEGLLLRGKQIVIPSSLRTDVLRHLHDGHQGITKTCEKR